MRLPLALKAFLAGSALFSLLCFGTEALCRLVLHWGYPYDYPGVRSWLLFGDFHDFFNKFHFFHSRAFFTEGGVLPYPAPAAAAYELFLIPLPTPHHGGAAIARFEGSILLASWVVLALFRRALVRHGLRARAATGFAFGTYAFSFAFWFEFMQGNIEWVICAVLLAGVWCVCHRHFHAAAICIGLAGSMKLYPIVLVGLLLSLRQYRAVLLTAVTAVASTVISLWLLCPDIGYSWTQTLAGMGGFEKTYMAKVRPVEVGFDHSLFALVKLCLRLITGLSDQQGSLSIYLATVALGGCALYLARIRKLPLTNQVLCLIIAAIVLPPLSYDYTLIHLYAGFGLLALFAVHTARANEPSAVQNRRPRGLLLAALLLAFVLSPESEFFFHGARFSGQLKCLALLALGYVSLRYPFRIPGLPGPADNLFTSNAEPDSLATDTPAALLHFGPAIPQPGRVG